MKFSFYRRCFPRYKVAVLIGGIFAALIIYNVCGNYRDNSKHICKPNEQTRLNTSLPPLLELLRDPNDRQPYAWIRMRINKLWTHWMSALNTGTVQNRIRNHRRKKKILLYLGFLSESYGRQFTDNQFKGGYLGELVQWSDLITSLYILGHDVTIASQLEQLDRLEYFFEPDFHVCDETIENPALIFTDIIGYHQMKHRLQQPDYHYRCRVRVLDCFGTDPAYNNRQYAVTHNKTSGWGGLDLNTQQIWTMFPHSPDNSLAGFVTISKFRNNQELHNAKEDIGLVYGKMAQFFKNKEEYLRVFQNNGLKLYATVRDQNSKDIEGLPDFVVNKGYMNVTDLLDLMTRTKIFIGLGEPLEGPGPLEAIAHGAIYFNPRFDPPFSYAQRYKPNDRQLTSQNPYAESLGQPYVFTVSVDDLTEVDRAVKTILDKNTFKAFLPLEYSIEGYLHRINSYIEQQDFCHVYLEKTWPPQDAISTILGKPGRSCKDTCMKEGLVCEPSHFQSINRKHVLQNLTNCLRYTTQADIYFPAIDREGQTCITQNNPKLFSCVGHTEKYSRLCPCRDSIPGQTALCKGCV